MPGLSITALGLGLDLGSAFPTLSNEVKMNALAKAGKLAAWYSTSDLTSLYLDDQAVGGNITADAETLGLMLDKAQMGGKTAEGFVDAQPELKQTGTTGTVGTATAATYNTTSGAGVVYRVDGSNLSYVLVPTGAGNRYAIDIETFGSPVFIRDSVGFAVLATTASSGRQTLYVSGAGTSISFTGTSAGSASFTLHSFKRVPGLHFLQSDTAKEPQFKKRLKANADLSGEAELVTNTDFDTVTNWHVNTSGGATISSVASSEVEVSIDTNQNIAHALDAPIPAFATAYVEVVLRSTGGGVIPRISLVPSGEGNGAANGRVYQPSSAAAYSKQTISFILTAGAVALYDLIIREQSGVSGRSIFVDSISVKEVPASQLYNTLYSPGVDELLAGTPSMYAQGGMVMVFGVSAVPQSGKAIVAECSTAAANPNYQVLTGTVDIAKPRLFIRNDAGTTLLDAEGTVSAFNGNRHVVRVEDYQVSGSDYAWRMTVDGQEAGSGTYTRSGTLTLNSSSMLASKHTTEAAFFNGDLGPDVIFADPSVVSASEIALMEAYIAEKMGVTLS